MLVLGRFNDKWLQKSTKTGGTSSSIQFIFTDECPVYLTAVGNQQTDRIWARDTKKVIPMEKSKFSSKIMIWGVMATTGASALHILLQNQTVAAQYSQENIHAPFFLEENPSKPEYCPDYWAKI